MLWEEKRRRLVQGSRAESPKLVPMGVIVPKSFWKVGGTLASTASDWPLVMIGCAS